MTVCQRALPSSSKLSIEWLDILNRYHPPSQALESPLLTDPCLLPSTVTCQDHHDWHCLIIFMTVLENKCDVPQEYLN